MKNKRKKLALHRQTIRNLTEAELRKPVSGAIWFSDQKCSSDGWHQCEPLTNDYDCPPPKLPGPV